MPPAPPPPPTPPIEVPPLARRPVLAAMGALAVVLTLTSQGYGYHRDELYFRMLEPAWGYVDQPPLTPALARLMSDLVDEPWALRLPATLAAVLCVLVTALLTREVGGDRRAQSLAAWGFAFAAFPLVFGHLLLTSGIDLLAWLAICLCVVRAVLRAERSSHRGGRWWLAAGVLVGAATWNKLLVVFLVVALVAGLGVALARRWLPARLPWGWLAAAAVAAVVVGLPTLLYQATHGWPQIEMGRALGAGNGSEVRVSMWPMLALLLGPPLVLVWGAGWWQLWRRPEWRPLRFLAVAFLVLLLLTAVAGGQVYYPLGLLSVLYAVGCLPAAARGPRTWRTLQVLVGVNALVSSVIALPLLPLSIVGDTPVPGINQAAQDQVGWKAYVAQVARVRDALPTDEQESTIVITSNYGEAGALDRYGPAHGLPAPFSGHNALAEQAVPPDSRVTAVVVGSGALRVATRFATCETRGRLDDAVDGRAEVDNEEQGEPIAVCRDPRTTWRQAWPGFRHLD